MQSNCTGPMDISLISSFGIEPTYETIAMAGQTLRTGPHLRPRLLPPVGQR